MGRRGGQGVDDLLRRGVLQGLQQGLQSTGRVLTKACPRALLGAVPLPVGPVFGAPGHL